MGFYEFMNEVVFAFLEGTVILLLFILVVDKKGFIKDNILRAVTFLTLYTVYSYWSTLYIPPIIHTLCFTIFLFISLCYITRSNIYASIVAIIVIILFLTITELIVLSIVMSFLKVDINTILNTPSLSFLVCTIVRITEFIFIYLLFKIKFKILKLQILKTENVASPMLFQIYMITVFFVSISYVVSYRSNMTLYFILLSIIYLIVVSLNIFDYRDRGHILRIKNKFQVQKDHVKNLEHVIDFIRKEKHDYANHLNTVYAMGILRKPDSLDKMLAYLKKLTQNVNSTYQFYNTGNDYIDGLLAVKSNIAHEKGITFSVNFEAPLNQIEITDSDLTSIVGNIVDNAFEAVSGKADEESKLVSISSYVEGDKYYLSIANNGPVIPEKTLEKIFESGFSTKTDNRAEHGYGLYIVKQMVERNKGKISVMSTEEETVFEVGFGIVPMNSN